MKKKQPAKFASTTFPLLLAALERASLMKMRQEIDAALDENERTMRALAKRRERERARKLRRRRRHLKIVPRPNQGPEVFWNGKRKPRGRPKPLTIRTPRT